MDCCRISSVIGFLDSQASVVSLCSRRYSLKYWQYWPCKVPIKYLLVLTVLSTVWAPCYNRLHAISVRQCVCADRWSCARHRSSTSVTPLCRHRRSRHESHSAIPRTIGHLVTHGLSPIAEGGRTDAAIRPASYFRTCDAHRASRCLAANDTCTTSLRRLSLRY